MTFVVEEVIITLCCLDNINPFARAVVLYLLRIAILPYLETVYIFYIRRLLRACSNNKTSRRKAALLEKT